MSMHSLYHSSEEIMRYTHYLQYFLGFNILTLTGIPGNLPKLYPTNLRIGQRDSNKYDKIFAAICDMTCVTFLEVEIITAAQKQEQYEKKMKYTHRQQELKPFEYNEVYFIYKGFEYKVSIPVYSRELNIYYPNVCLYDDSSCFSQGTTVEYLKNSQWHYVENNYECLSMQKIALSLLVIYHINLKDGNFSEWEFDEKLKDRDRLLEKMAAQKQLDREKQLYLEKFNQERDEFLSRT